ncbi:MAG: hypothetical protein WCF23_05015 [Candidatus Nitrosopolaris sp.]
MLDESCPQNVYKNVVQSLGQFTLVDDSTCLKVSNIAANINIMISTTDE